MITVAAWRLGASWSNRTTVIGRRQFKTVKFALTLLLLTVQTSGLVESITVVEVCDGCETTCVLMMVMGVLQLTEGIGSGRASL